MRKSAFRTTFNGSPGVDLSEPPRSSAPDSVLATSWNDGLRNRIAIHLRGFPRHSAEAVGVRAAVAIVILADRNGEACVPVCLRAAGLNRHASQFSLPGGRVDGDESVVAAALRELREELDISVTSNAALGALDDFHTRSGFTITPWVVWSEHPSWDLHPAIDEIERLYLPTLGEIERAAESAAPGVSSEFSLGFPWADLYAPTAALLYQFSEVALNGRICRVADFYQPPFTSR